jgi:hypothetical protein
MNTQITDVIIHTRDQLSDQQFAEVSRNMYKTEGVVSFSRNVHTPRFLMVVYNTGKTKAGSILTAITEQGYDASVVGI